MAGDLVIVGKLLNDLRLRVAGLISELDCLVLPRQCMILLPSVLSVSFLARFLPLHQSKSAQNFAAIVSITC